VINEMSMAKFMQTLDDEIYEKLSKIAKERGLTVQELIRAVIIPFWLGYQEPEQIKKRKSSECISVEIW